MAYADLRRIHEFLEPVNPVAAEHSVRAIVARVRRIPAQPRLGETLTAFGNRGVRRVLVQGYEVRYEIAGSDIHVLRIIHTRENRPSGWGVWFVECGFARRSAPNARLCLPQRRGAHERRIVAGVFQLNSVHRVSLVAT